MSLLRADLTSLANLPRAAVGRRLLLQAGIGLGLLALLSWWIADNVMANRAALILVHQQGGDSQLGLIGMGLMPCPVAATWIGLSLAQRQLFDTPELGLWQSAPIRRWRGAVQILLRACFLAVVWATALSSPFVLTLLAHSNAPALAYALLPLAILGATVPLIAALLVFQIVLVRLFAGRALRVFLTALGAAASVGFSTWLLVIMFSDSDGGGTRLVERTASADSLPWTVDSGARLVTAAARSGFDATALRATLGWLLLASALFWLGARLHPGALEAHRLAEPPSRRRRSAWPASLAATIRRKELAQVLQQPGALIGFLIFAFLVFALVERQVLVGGILANYRLPADTRHLGAMLAQWFLATVLVLYPHMGRLVLWDAAQWSLYATSPAARSTILRGKLEAVGLLLLWPLLLVAAVSGHGLGASPGTIAAFLAIAVPGTLIALGVLAIVGTLPWLVRPEDGGAVAQGGRGFFASLLLIFAFELAVSPGVFGWLWLSAWARENPLTQTDVREWTPAVIGVSWGLGLAILGLGIAIGARNYRRLSEPRR